MCIKTTQILIHIIGTIWFWVVKPKKSCAIKSPPSPTLASQVGSVGNT